PVSVAAFSLVPPAISYYSARFLPSGRCTHNISSSSFTMTAPTPLLLFLSVIFQSLFYFSNHYIKFTLHLNIVRLLLYPAVQCCSSYSLPQTPDRQSFPHLRGQCRGHQT